MALKGPRVILETEITLTCESVASRGVVLVHVTSGSGVALGASAGEADLKANPSGYKIAGLLMNDVVSTDQTRYHHNFHKDETQTGERCTLLRKGRVTTDKIIGTPAVDDIAYLTSSGNLTPTIGAGGLVATPKVGKFVSIKDEAGFVTVDLNLPVV